ncbi:hypothetical protein [Acinetobacter sp.]|uniref:hypothetical protein n=1 Tax=Acinetobacter sp. TaxID=472 RepID=UPI00388E4900
MTAQKSEETIVFLPWTVDAMTQAVTVENPEKNKIYVDLAHSTDWVVAASVLLSFFGFLLTVYVVRKSTQSQIESNNNLCASQQKIKLMEIQESRNLQIIHELCAIENSITNIQIVLKKASDSDGLQSLSLEDRENTLKAMNSLRLHIINITHFVKAYKVTDIKQDGLTVHNKIDKILVILNNEGRKDTELLALIGLTKDFIDKIHNLLKQKAA